MNPMNMLVSGLDVYGARNVLEPGTGWIWLILFLLFVWLGKIAMDALIGNNKRRK